MSDVVVALRAQRARRAARRRCAHVTLHAHVVPAQSLANQTTRYATTSRCLTVRQRTRRTVVIRRDRHAQSHSRDASCQRLRTRETRQQRVYGAHDAHAPPADSLRCALNAADVDALASACVTVSPLTVAVEHGQHAHTLLTYQSATSVDGDIVSHNVSSISSVYVHSNRC
jgi:hypothetical protein